MPITKLSKSSSITKVVVPQLSLVPKKRSHNLLYKEKRNWLNFLTFSLASLKNK